MKLFPVNWGKDEAHPGGLKMLFVVVFVITKFQMSSKCAKFSLHYLVIRYYAYLDTASFSQNQK